MHKSPYRVIPPVSSESIDTKRCFSESRPIVDVWPKLRPVSTLRCPTRVSHPSQTTLVCPLVDYSTLAQVPLVMTQAASIKSREPAITDCTLIGIL